MEFREDVFLYALSSRPVDAKNYMGFFQPEWLNNAEYVPILREIFAFTKQHGTPPSYPALHERFQDLDPAAYQARYKATLEGLGAANPSLSEVVQTLYKAKGVAICRGLDSWVGSQDFLVQKARGDGYELLQQMGKLTRHFKQAEDAEIMTLEESVVELQGKVDIMNPNRKVQSGIWPIDKWTEGGIKRRNLGIIMAPTGHGKSVSLGVIAHHVASVEDLNVMFFTNELTIDEVTERLLARLADKGIGMKEITEDAIYARGPELARRWISGVQHRIVLAYVKHGRNTDYIEGVMEAYTAAHGWKPDVVIVDHMGRMSPNEKGHNPDATWTYQTAIAQDLTYFAKRHNVVLWTAAQTNRGGLSAEDLVPSHVQGSIGPMQEAACFVGMHREKRQELEKTKYVSYQFFNMKQRHAHMDERPVSVKADLSKMTILDEELPQIPKTNTGGNEGDEDNDSIAPTNKAKRGQKVHGMYQV